MRRLISVLCAFLLLVATAAPAAAAEITTSVSAKEEILRILYNRDGTYTIVTRGPTVDLAHARVFVARRTVRVDWETFRRHNDAVLRYVLSRRSPTGGDYYEPRMTGDYLSMALQAIPRIGLLMRQIADIHAALRSITTDPSAMENLRDPAKRYEFWKKQGIYDKYNRQEIEFMNSVAFPVAAISGAFEFLAGSALAAAGGAAILGPWGAVALGTATLLLGGAELLKIWQDVQAGRQVDPGAWMRGLLSRTGAALQGSFGIAGIPGVLSKFVVFKAAGASLAAGEAAVLFGLSGLLSQGAGSLLTGDAAVFLGKLANVWGVPVPAGEVPVSSLELCGDSCIEAQGGRVQVMDEERWEVHGPYLSR